jgi:hypothetical protein
MGGGQQRLRRPAPRCHHRPQARALPHTHTSNTRSLFIDHTHAPVPNRPTPVPPSRLLHPSSTKPTPLPPSRVPLRFHPTYLPPPDAAHAHIGACCTRSRGRMPSTSHTSPYAPPAHTHTPCASRPPLTPPLPGSIFCVHGGIPSPAYLSRAEAATPRAGAGPSGGGGGAGQAGLVADINRIPRYLPQPDPSQVPFLYIAHMYVILCRHNQGSLSATCPRLTPPRCQPRPWSSPACCVCVCVRARGPGRAGVLSISLCVHAARDVLCVHAARDVLCVHAARDVLCVHAARDVLCVCVRVQRGTSRRAVRDAGAGCARRHERVRRRNAAATRRAWSAARRRV